MALHHEKSENTVSIPEIYTCRLSIHSNSKTRVLQSYLMIMALDQIVYSEA